MKKQEEAAHQNKLIQLINFDKKYKNKLVLSFHQKRDNYRPTFIDPPEWVVPKIFPMQYCDINFYMIILINLIQLLEKYGGTMTCNIGSGIINRIVNCAVLYMNEHKYCAQVIHSLY